MVAYATTSELKYRLGIDDNDRDFALEQVVDAASRWIEGEVNRRFYAVTETRYYSADYQRTRYAYGYGFPIYDSQWALERPWGARGYVMIDDALSVSTVATDEDGDGVYERTWTVGTDYWLGPRNAPANGKPYRTLNRNPVAGRYYFPVYEGSVAVTGSFGYSTTVPSDIRELCLQVGELMARPVLDSYMPGVATYKLSTELSVTVASTELPMTARQTLEGYREFMGVL